MTEAATLLPHRAPYTVDDLFDMPDDGNRYEAFGGSLIVSPAPTPKHQWIGDRLARIFTDLLPVGAYAVTACVVRLLPDDDGAVPDVVVTGANPLMHPRGFPSEMVGTVVEVVSPGSVMMDRRYKPEAYADAWIPCYWRVETDRLRDYAGALPMIVVRLRTDDGWQTHEAVAGMEAELPLAVSAKGDELVTVRIDPAVLLCD